MESLIIGLIVTLVTEAPHIVAAVQGIVASTTMSPEEKAKALAALGDQLAADEAKVKAVTFQQG